MCFCAPEDLKLRLLIFLILIVLINYLCNIVTVLFNKKRMISQITYETIKTVLIIMKIALFIL